MEHPTTVSVLERFDDALAARCDQHKGHESGSLVAFASRLFPERGVTA